MKNGTKKLIMAVLAIVAVATLTIAGTMAFLSSTDSVTNTLTIGNVKIKVEEPKWPGTPCTPGVPGDTTPKNPFVTNTGGNKCIIRVDLVIPQSKSTPVQDIYTLNESTIVTDITQWITGTWYRPLSGTGFVANKNYIYYYDIVNAGDHTTEMFTSVTLKNLDLTGFGTGANKSVEIKINAEAMQARFNNHDVLPGNSTVADSSGEQNVLSAFVAYWGQ